MALLNPATTLPASSQDALEIFDERYLAALRAANHQTWLSELGDVHDTAALSTHYPMSFLALKFQETKALAGRFKRIGEKEVELTVAEYDDGVEIELLKLATNVYSARKWNDVPAEMMHAEEQFKLKLIADALGANTAACGWDDLALFHDSHLANPDDASKGTFDNLQATTKDVADLANLAAEITAGAEVLDTNGDPLGVEFDTIIVPRQKGQLLKNLLKQDFVPSTTTPGAGTTTMRNPYFSSGINVVVANQLTDNNDWYLVDSKLIRQIPPWVVAKLNIANPAFDALGLRRWTPENSDDCRRKGTVAVSKHIYYGSKFLFPHAIRKVAGA